MTKGLPASGKTTWAKKVVSEFPNAYKRVNKDDLRAMIDNGKWSKSAERFILNVRDYIVKTALEHGYHVIVDDTNLEPKHEERLREIAKAQARDVQFQIKDFTDVPLQVCKDRDKKRQNPVGRKVIMDMYNRYLYKEIPKPEKIEGAPEAIICDLDGTLSLLNGRNPYDASTCADDLLNTVVYNILINFKYKPTKKLNNKILLVSGRSDEFRKETIEFLVKNKVPYDKLLMRKAGDTRKDATVKEEIYNEHIKGKYNVEMVLDDRNQVVEFWRSIGLTCLQVADGDF